MNFVLGYFILGLIFAIYGGFIRKEKVIAIMKARIIKIEGKESETLLKQAYLYYLVFQVLLWPVTAITMVLRAFGLVKTVDK